MKLLHKVNNYEKINIRDIEAAYNYLENDLNEPYIRQNDSYIISYKEFVKYFSALTLITEHNLIIGAHFTYGWMPTIIGLHLDSTNKHEAIRILNYAKSGNVLNKHDLDIIRRLINNSLVGASKMLHFIRPDKYAIWDSRVYWFINREDAYDYRISKTSNYLEYLDMCSLITSDERFNPIHDNINKKMGYEVTSFRAIELIMYNAAIKMKMNVYNTIEPN